MDKDKDSSYRSNPYLLYVSLYNVVKKIEISLNYTLLHISMKNPFYKHGVIAPL